MLEDERRPKMLTRNPWLMAVSLLALAAPEAMAQTNVGPIATPEHPLLIISATEAVTSDPDMATVGAGVQTVSRLATTAMGDNAVKMERVIAALKAKGIPAKDIQTTGVGLAAEYDYNNLKPGELPRFIGYRASNSVRAVTRDVPKIGALLDALVAAGGTSIEGPFFSIKDNRTQLSLARDRAMDSANARAQEYAKRAGFAHARLVVLSEGYQGGPVPVSALSSEILVTARAVSAAPPPPPPPVAPGQMATAVTLSAQYQLER
jgi:uncharacterized protein